MWSLQVLRAGTLLLIASLSASLSDPLTTDTRILVDWDLAMAHGNNVTLMTVSSNSSADFALPMPIAQNYGTTSQGNSWIDYQTMREQWTRLEISSLVSVPERNLLFFSHFNSNLTNVGVFNLANKQTTLILQSPGGTVDYMVYHNGTLYFVEEKSQLIMSVDTEQLDFTNVSFTVIMNYKNNRLTGIAIDPDTGIMYWGTYKPGPSTISFGSEDKQKILIDSDLGRAHGLMISGSYLYFINTPQSGYHFKIERVSLLNPSDRQIVVRYRHQLPVSLAMLCGRLYWADFLSKSVYALHLGNGPLELDADTAVPEKIFESKVTTDNFYIPPMYAVERRMDLDLLSCVEKNMSTFPTTTTVLETNFTTESPGADFHRPLAVSTTSTPLTNLRFCTASTCSNGGTCISLDSEEFCLCQPDYAGPTCDLKWEQNLMEPNLSSAATDTQVLTSPSQAVDKYMIASVVLAVILVGMLVLTVFLGFKLYKLGGGPRITRRVIVSRKPNDSSDGSLQTVAEMVDIENCCNMNVCETPCYSTEGSRITLNGRFEDDKERLLEA